VSATAKVKSKELKAACPVCGITAKVEPCHDFYVLVDHTEAVANAGIPPFENCDGSGMGVGKKDIVGL